MIYQIKSKYNFSKPQRTPTCTNRTTNFYRKKNYKTSKHTNKLHILHKNAKKINIKIDYNKTQVRLLT